MARAEIADVFGDRLRQARQRKKHSDGRRWTQADLAAMIGAKPNTVNGWENRGVVPPRATRMTLANVLDVPIEYLDGETDSWEPVQQVREPNGVAYFTPAAALKNRLPPRAYELVYGYLRKLEGIGLPVESIEVAERFLMDAAFNKLNARDPRERTEDDMMKDLRSAWVFVKEVLGPKAESL